MATTSFTLPGQVTNDADFRAWGSAISTALAAMGLVKTSDTGQIDWTTVLKPTTANGVAGYEMWRFNDTLQATAPVFIKIEYGVGGGVTIQSLWVTVGTGTNGAGTLVGQVGNRYRCFSSFADGTGSISYISGANNRIHMALNASRNLSNSTGMVLSVERTKDATGADDATGICMYSMAAAATTSFAAQDQVVPFTGTIPAQDGSPAVAASAGTSAVSGADVGVFPHFPVLGKALPPELGLISYKNADIAALSQVGVTLYSVSHNYLALGNTPLGYSSSSRQDPNMTLLMRYE